MHNRILFLKKHELERISTDHHNLGAKFCRQTLKNGGVSISVHESLIKQDLTGTYKKWQTARYETKLTNYKYMYNIHLHITYRQFAHLFFKGLDKILNLLCSTNIEFITCGDISC
jgi:hypothetical protein